MGMKILTDILDWFYEIYRVLRYNVVHIKNLIHRAKHGWCVEDTWELDETIPTYLSNVLGEFSSQLDGEVKDTEDTFSEYAKNLTKKSETVKTIKEGFDDYLMFNNETYFLYATGEITKKEYKKEEARMRKNLARSFKLLEKNLGNLWW